MASPGAGLPGASPGPGLPGRLRTLLDRNPALLPRDRTVLIALSGGPDSTALLHLLLELVSERGWRLYAAHLDHGLRPESLQEARLVASRARAAGVPCAVGRAPAGMSRSQEAFRRERYRFLREEAHRIGADRVATGHQADDQAETVLFRILRGTGLRGLGGIPLRRGRIVRPLLHFRRDELAEWLEERGIPWLRDRSNLDPRWTRSRIRHEVMPLLDEVAGGPVAPRLRGLARLARRAERALERTARRALEEALLGPDDDARRTRIARPSLLAYDPEIQARAIRALARHHGAELTRGGTRAAVEFIKRGRSGAAIDVSEGLRLGRDFDTLWLGASPEREPDRGVSIYEPGAGEARTHIGGTDYVIRWTAEPSEAEREQPRGAVLPLDRIAFPLRLRGPRPGDRLRLPRGGRKLKKLFAERRVPRWERPRVPVLEDAEGRLVWVAGLGSATFAVPGRDEEVFVVTIDRAPARAAAREPDS